MQNMFKKDSKNKYEFNFSMLLVKRIANYSHQFIDEEFNTIPDLISHKDAIFKT